MKNVNVRRAMIQEDVTMLKLADAMGMPYTRLSANLSAFELSTEEQEKLIKTIQRINSNEELL